MQCGLFLTAIWTILLIQNGVQLSKGLASRQPGYLDFDNLPETNFTCEGKVIGGYYADVETGCQMFHVCTIGQKGDMTDIKFLCLNGTVFDQETRVCERVDEVDCSKSKDFYDLNLELYNNGFILPEDDSGADSSKPDLDDDLYDENYDADTEDPPPSSPKTPPTTSTTTPKPTTTSTTTTQPPILFTSIKPPFNIILPNLNNKNPSTAPPQPHYPNKNLPPHLPPLLPTKNIHITHTQRPFPFLTTQPYTPDHFKPPPPIDTALKPPPTPTTTFKPPPYDPYKNHFFSSTPTVLINSFKKPLKDTPRPPPDPPKRPVLLLAHHFPTLNPLPNPYDDFPAFSSPSAPALPFLRQKPRPPHPHHHKPNPTILALQSQQQKVHRLHQEGLEIAEHQIAQIASRNAEISGLRTHHDPAPRTDPPPPPPAHREPKETKTGDARLRNPAIAVVTSTSSTSTRVHKPPARTVQPLPGAPRPPPAPIHYHPDPDYKTDLEKLFPNTEVPNKAKDEPDMDLEQLLLAWKLKTNQEVTKEDIEKVFARLDTSKFQNGQTISLSDIFNLMGDSGDSGDSAEETTRVPPVSYDEYTEEDVPYDPFYKDVPKVSGKAVRRRRGAGGRRAGFSCAGRLPGGLYADAEADCRQFHVCSPAGDGRLVAHKFFCGDGTKFNQRSRTCQAEALVDCPSSSRYFHLDRNSLMPKDEPVPEINFEPVKTKS